MGAMTQDQLNRKIKKNFKGIFSSRIKGEDFTEEPPMSPKTLPKLFKERQSADKGIISPPMAQTRRVSNIATS